MLRKLGLYFRTLRHLKRKQFYFQAYYRLTKVLALNKSYSVAGHILAYPIQLSQPSIDAEQSWTGNRFSFLNLSKNFPGKVDWNFNEYGKLWTYNLNYFDFLMQ